MSFISKLLFIALGDELKASSRVRVFWLAEAINKPETIIKEGVNPLVLLIATTSRTIVFQKNTSYLHVLAATFLSLIGKKTVFDIDDYPSMNNSEITMRNFRRICKRVDFVTAGSTNLVDLCKVYNRNTFLLPTGIRLQNYTKIRTQFVNKVCIGWIGNGKHYGKDLIEILLPALSRLTQKHHLRLKLVGTNGNAYLKSKFIAIQNLECVFVDNLDWSDSNAVDNALRDFNIGVYPLVDNQMNRYKCGFKALEYYAKSIPVVSSDVAMNKEIVLHEITGFVVNNLDDWISALDALITNVDLRIRMGVFGFQHVKENFAIEKVALRFEELILND